MSIKEPKQITTEQMRALLERHPTMSPASRHALITGQCPFVDGDEAWQAPQTEDSATHQMHAAIDPVLTHGVQPCKLN